jgi:hypothetical protein
MKTMSLAGIADDPETGLLNNFLPGNESYLSSVEPGLLGSSETTSLSSVGEMAVLENSINLFEDSREGETADSFAPMISLKMPRSGKKPSGSNQLLGDRLFQGILAYSDLLKNDIRLI